MKIIRNDERGAVNMFLIISIILGVVVVGLGVGFGWAYLGMNEAQSDLDAKIEAAVESAVLEQQEISDLECDERNKEPFFTFYGPSDLGSVKFEYPRTWSSYVEDDGATSGNMKYYFHPGAVPKINEQTIYALRLSVENRKYEDVLQTYEARIRNGQLSAAPIVVNEHNGMRISGSFSTAIANGTAAIFAIRDKTLILRTDSADFLNDFDGTILNSLQYNE
jgi:hypothetical protein